MKKFFSVMIAACMISTFVTNSVSARGETTHPTFSPLHATVSSAVYNAATTMHSAIVNDFNQDGDASGQTNCSQCH